MRITRRAALGLSFGLLLTCVSSSATSIAADAPKRVLAIVVARDSSIVGMSFYDLKRAFMGESTAVSGARLVPLNFTPNSRERIAFDTAVLKMSPEEVARYWIDRKIRGLPGSPRAVAPVDVLMKVVSRLPGAVSYVDVRDVSADVKVISIDGKLPSDPGYPLTF
jgi:hypothetical protein